MFLLNRQFYWSCDLFELLNSLKDTSLPNILVIAGILFLVLAIAGGITGQIKVQEASRKWSALLGGAFLIIGILIYLAPKIEKNVGQQLTANTTIDTVIQHDHPDDEEFKLTLAKGWTAVVDDDLKINLRNWPEETFKFNNIEGEQKFLNDKYIWSFRSPVGNVYKFAIPSLDPIDDFLLSLTYKKTGTIQSSVYLFIRKEGDNSYALRVQGDRFKFVLIKDKVWTDLISWTISGSVKKNSENTISAIADKSDFYFFINDNFIGHVQNDVIKRGNLGIGVGIYPKDETETYEFSKFIIKKK
jgi:hypothetical protein